MQAFAILAASFLIGHALGQDTPSLTELLRSTAELSQFASVASQAPDLLSSLLSAANVTILAPSNDAFAAVGNDSLQALAANSGLLTKLLQYHVLNGTFQTTYFTQSSKFVPSLLTDPQFTNVTGGQRIEGVQSGSNIVFYSGLLSNSTVTSAGLTFTGGVVHVIDKLLVLPELVTDTTVAANLTSLTGALEATSLQQTIDTSKDLTLFAPTNLAFQGIGSVLANLTTENLVDILAYHAIQGSPVNIDSYGYGQSTTLESIQGSNITITTGQNGVFVNNARVIVPNVLVANGVMHIIDAVLNPTNQTIASSTATSGVIAYAGAESVTDGVFTSGVPTPSGNIIPPSQSSGSSTGSDGNPSGPNSGSGGLSTGAKAGIGIGAAAGAALLLGVGVLLGRKGKNKQGGTTATTATGVAEMEDQDRSHAKKKWFLGGRWRSEADAQQPAQELDSKMVHVVGGPPAELDGSGSALRR